MFENLERKLGRESPKSTIFASGGLGLLQMLSEPDIGLCASEEAKPRRGVTPGEVLVRTLGPEGGWIRGSHIDWRGERLSVRTLDSEGG